MASVALVQRASVEVSLESEIRAFIPQYLKLDIGSLDAHSHLTDDFGLDLFDITELLIVLEERFGVEPESTDELKQIEFVCAISSVTLKAVDGSETRNSSTTG